MSSSSQAVHGISSRSGSEHHHGTRTSGHKISGVKRGRESHGQDYYYRQWRRLKKVVKDLIFINSSVCDEVIRVEEKLARVKEERRYLLRKLLQFQSVTDVAALTVNSECHPAPSKSSKSPVGSSAQDQTSDHPGKKTTKKKAAAPSTASSISEPRKKAQQSAKELLESLQAKPKKSKSQSNRKTIPPMLLDSLGRPVFPMVLGDLTLHSIGEIVPDRSTFFTHDCIYPAGFCSTRVYASMTRPEEKCLYTCKISDSGDLPEFEIAPEEGTEQVLRGSTPNECHLQLILTINAAIGTDLLPAVGSGADFFGLNNPVVQNLIQSCPGAKKCAGYKWIKFEINKAETNENMAVGKNDPTINIDAFHRLLAQAGGMKAVAFSSMSEHHSTSLRSLLTKGNISFAS
ncbi:transforming growth factor beta regulator 1-like isoform X2 [Pomacea canaliculata]|uniref:transforming growth factor beta regulator 1-like isoform X2 n=1 Tax=Pomacea canaliculata TaxID=400727 RepID=UPI000D73C069|nr:transforming growth factor beta regulator 1-like isoform X2 [Pomacea canaliculata]